MSRYGPEAFAGALVRAQPGFWFPLTRSVLAAAAGGAAAFADVAAAGRAHLGAAGQAQRSVRGPALLGLDQLGRAVRSGRGGRKGGGSLLDRGGNHSPFGMSWFYGGRLGKFLGIHL